REVDVEERLKAVEDVGAANRFDVGERERDAVALGEFEHQLGFERALDMQVDLGLRELAYPVGSIGGRRGRAHEESMQQPGYRRRVQSSASWPRCSLGC